MTEIDNRRHHEAAENDRVTPLQIRRERLYRAEEGLPSSITAIAVVRPPRIIRESEMSAFYKSLLGVGILPIATPIPTDNPNGNFVNFPTDQYREVGGRILVANSSFGIDDDLNALYSTLESSNDTRPFSPALWGNEKAAGIPFSGGIYVYDEHSKIFIYDRTELGIDEETSGRRDWGLTNNTLNQLKDDGWNIIPIDLTRDEATIGEVREDLDFIISSPFRGKDGETYMFAAQPLIPKLTSDSELAQTGIHLLPVPEEEVLKGGCNIADLNRSRVLACANHADAPTVFSRLTELAEAKVIQTPRGFLDDGGGPRCSISSISIPNAT